MRGTIKNRIAKHYLRQWGHFDSNFEHLTNAEEVKMKTLYIALKELESNERSFLASKYRVSVKPAIKDAVLAENQGITLKEYREKRIAIETKFQAILDTKIPLYQEELKKALDIDFGRVREV